MSKPSLSKLAVVAAGGTLGTASRAGIALAMATEDPGQFPLATFTVNVAGAFLLGVLFTFLPWTTAQPDDSNGAPESLSRRGRGSGIGDRHGSNQSSHAEATRLLLGTGFLGGFTTYSALAVDAAGLLPAHPLVGVGYALATLFLGGLATWLGILSAHVLAFQKDRVRGEAP